MGRQKVLGSIEKAARGVLQDGETIEVVTVAMTSQLSGAKVMAAGAAVAVLTGGMATAFVRPKKLCVALTSHRLLFFASNELTGRATSKLVSEVPRSALTTLGERRKLVMLMMPTLVVELAVSGAAKGLKLQFPTPCRAEGRQIAAALTSQGAPAAPSGR